MPGLGPPQPAHSYCSVDQYSSDEGGVGEEGKVFKNSLHLQFFNQKINKLRNRADIECSKASPQDLFLFSLNVINLPKPVNAESLF